MNEEYSHDELDKHQITSLLQQLGQKLQSRNLKSTIQVVGGAAIALTLKDHRSTHDIDAMILDHPDEFKQAASEVATENNVDPQWISDDISDFIADSPEGEETEIVMDGVSVYVASPEHLLAMKTRAAAARGLPRDNSDLVMLAEHLGLDTPDQVAQLTSRQFQGAYRDRLSNDEYYSAAEYAFMEHDIENGVDPMLRWNKPKTAESAYEKALRESSARAAALESESESFDFDY